MKLRQLKIGEVFELAGYEWVLLEHDVDEDKSLVVTKECIADMPFDEDNSNDFRSSTLRKCLNNEFLEELIREGLDEGEILYTDFDLTDINCEGDYGFCRDKIGLLTIDQYRKHKKVLSLNDNWCLITPSTDFTDLICVVTLHRSLLMDDARKDGYGVRPALYLKSDINIPVDKETNLEDYSNEELLQELLRR